MLGKAFKTLCACQNYNQECPENKTNKKPQQVRDLKSCRAAKSVGVFTEDMA